MEGQIQDGAFRPGPADRQLQDELARQGADPMLCRYEELPRGGLRGVVVTSDGSLHYFVWADLENGEALLVPATGDRVMELTKFAATLPFGFQPGAKSLGSELPGPESEESSIAHQDERTRGTHPGATASATGPDDPEVGRDWHEGEPEESEEEESSDDFDEKVAALHEASARLRRSNMKIAASPLEERFLRSELKKSASGTEPLTAAERAMFERWKVGLVRKSADRLARKARGE